MLSLLGLPYERTELNLPGGEHKRPEFLAKNPFGQVPVLEDGDITLPESNAILVYLASRYDAEGRWLPRDARSLAAVQRWLSVAAGPLYLGPALARMVRVFGAKFDIERAQHVAAQLFQVLEQQVQEVPFLVGETPTIADVALYSYTAVAPEGGVPLDPYPHLRGWLLRIEALPNFLSMPRAKGSA